MNRPFIENVKIENFRCYKKIETSFNENITVIVGNNGAGKSTFLDAISLLLSAYLNGFDGYGLNNIAEEDIRKEVIGDDFGTQYITPVKIEGQGYIDFYQTDRLVWSREKKNIKGNMSNCSKPATEIGKKFQDMVKGQNPNVILPIVAYYGTGRLWENKGITDLSKAKYIRQDGYKECLNAHLNVKMLTTWFEQMTYLELQGRGNTDVFASVKKAVVECLKSVLSPKDIVVGYDLQKHDIELKYADATGKKYRMLLSELSDGYRGAICLFADIAYRMAILNPHLKGNVLKETYGIVLIDEVDLHLHPLWQQTILADLQTVFPKIQFVVTSHAPEVINSIKRDCLIVIENGNIEYAGIETYGKDANSILRCVMNVNERPGEIIEQFEDFYACLDNEKYTEAERILVNLENILGNDDAELTECRIRLNIEKM